jgi:hypothetical protein
VITAVPNGIAFKQAGGVRWSPKKGGFLKCFTHS